MPHAAQKLKVTRMPAVLDLRSGAHDTSEHNSMQGLLYTSQLPYLCSPLCCNSAAALDSSLDLGAKIYLGVLNQ